MLSLQYVRGKKMELDFDDKICKIHQAFIEAKYETGLELVKSLEDTSSLTHDEYNSVQFLKVRLLSDSARYDETNQLIDNLLKNKPTINVKFDLLLLKCVNYSYTFDKEKMCSIIDQLEELLLRIKTKKSVQFKKSLGWYYHIKGLSYNFKGNHEDALKIIKNGVTLFEEIGEEVLLCPALTTLGTAQLFLGGGALEEGLQTTKKSLLIAKRLGYVKAIIWNSVNIGEMYRLRGNLDKALEMFHEVLLLEKQSNSIREEMITENNIAAVYSQKGMLDKALDYYKRALMTSEKLKSDFFKSSVLYFTGMVYRQKGDLLKSLDYYKRGLKLQEEVGRNLEISEILLLIITNLLDMGIIREARSYLKKFAIINEIEDNKLIYIRYRLAEALFLKNSGRSRDIIKATDKLEEIIDEDLQDNQFENLAIISLCECLLEEFRAFGEIETFNRVISLINELNELAKQQSAIPLLINTTILQAKLTMIQGSLNDSEVLLDKAKDIADRNDLQSLSKMALKEKNRLKSQFTKWQKLINTNASFQIRLKEAQLADYIEEAKNIVSTRSS